MVKQAKAKPTAKAKAATDKMKESLSSRLCHLGPSKKENNNRLVKRASANLVLLILKSQAA